MTVRRLAALAALAALCSPLPPLAAQSAADSAGIRQAALDYIEGYYDGDAARIERAVHPELAKRIVRTNEQGHSQLGQMSAMTLVQGTRAGGGKDTPVAEGTRTSGSSTSIRMRRAPRSTPQAGSTICISPNGTVAG